MGLGTFQSQSPVDSLIGSNFFPGVVTPVELIPEKQAEAGGAG